MMLFLEVSESVFEMVEAVVVIVACLYVIRKCKEN